MFNTSYRIIQNTTEAEDIMQEAFIDAFKKIDTYQGTGTFGSWLKRIVINKTLDAVKKYKPETFSIDENEIGDIEQEGSDDSYAEHVFYQMEKIAQALDRIPEDYRIILSLHLLEGYDHQEIAQVLNISYNNVRTRYSRAKQSLINEINQSKSQHHNSTAN